MKDTIIANTGNSRYLKSGISATTTWEQFRAMLIAGSAPIDLNGLNNEGITQLGTLLNTANLLPSAVCSILGLAAASAVPADAYGKLADYVNFYWWKKWTSRGKGIKLTAANIPTYTIPQLLNDSGSHGSSRSIRIEYGDSVSISGDSISIDNPSSVNVYKTSDTAAVGHTSILGKYFKVAGITGPGITTCFTLNTIYFCKSSATLDVTTLTGGIRVEIGDFASPYIISAEENTKQYAPEFVAHTSSIAYPENGTSGGFWYERQGKVGNAPRVDVGSYMGTGVYGAANKNSLTFDFIPKFVLVCSGGAPYIPAFRGMSITWRETFNDNTGNTIYLEWNGKTLSWYSTDSDYGARGQLNYGMHTYYYIAIG